MHVNLAWSSGKTFTAQAVVGVAGIEPNGNIHEVRVDGSSYLIQSITKKDPLKHLEGEKRFVVTTLKSLTSEDLHIDRLPEVGPRNLHRVRVPGDKDEQKVPQHHIIV